MSEPVHDTGGAYAPQGDAQPQAGDAPAEPTPAQEQAQQEQGGEGGEGGGGEDDGSDRAREQYNSDAQARLQNPDKPLVREAQQGIGGESFDYLTKVSAR